MAITKLLIARHGNTFRADETPRRVGKNTDLDLVETQKGEKLGRYLFMNHLLPDVIYSSPLKRCIQTAELVAKEVNIDTKNIILKENFSEIDYGPDENKTEFEVAMRLGKIFFEGQENIPDILIEEKGHEIIRLWNQKTLVPPGWQVNTGDIIQTWENFAESIPSGQTVLIISSNGIIRFAPFLTSDFNHFSEQHDIKVGTGNLCIFEKEDFGKWVCTGWNIKPNN